MLFIFYFNKKLLSNTLRENGKECLLRCSKNWERVRAVIVEQWGSRLGVDDGDSSRAPLPRGRPLPPTWEDQDGIL